MVVSTIAEKTLKNTKNILAGIINKNDRFAFTMCNPPFHASMEKATQGSLLKQNNLAKKGKGNNEGLTTATLNFSGQAHELSCEGGEIAFVKQMITESIQFKKQVCWFTCLLSKSENVSPLKKHLQQQGAKEMKVIEMSQGHKISRFIAWSYLDIEQQRSFIEIK